MDYSVRKTYYSYKEKCVSVAEIESMEDMKKLRNANTSTRERLSKTVKKYTCIKVDSTSHLPPNTN